MARSSLLDREKCGNCRFFLHSAEDESVRQNERMMPIGHRIGWCRRNAPKPLEGGSGTGWADWEWPSVRLDDWCGEFETRYAAREMVCPSCGHVAMVGGIGAVHCGPHRMEDGTFRPARQMREIHETENGGDDE